MDRRCPGTVLIAQVGGDWDRPPGFPAGLEKKVPAGGLSETAKSRHRTGLTRCEPGPDTAHPFVHDYLEELFVVSGSLQGQAGTVFKAEWIVCRPPDTSRGPFLSADGCILLDTHYFDQRA